MVATFECIGLYWDRPASAYGCRVCYRAAGAEGWRDRYPLVYDARERQYCGSLVGLAADTTYDIRLEAGGERADRADVELRLSDRKDDLSAGGRQDKSITITEGGSESGWHWSRRPPALNVAITDPVEPGRTLRLTPVSGCAASTTTSRARRLKSACSRRDGRCRSSDARWLRSSSEPRGRDTDWQRSPGG